MSVLSQDSPDIRSQVDASRGPQKNLELLIPGLRNYRKLDDLRVADSMLRNQVADKLLAAKAVSYTHLTLPTILLV